MRRERLTACWQVFLCIIFAGCKVGPIYAPPEIDLPQGWHSPLSEGMSSSQSDCIVWWESLHDPLLNALMQRAAQENLDLFIAAGRILESRLSRKGKEGELYPHIDGSATAGHLYLGKEALFKTLFANDCKHSRKKKGNVFEMGFDAGWEVDLFGFNKHEIEAAEANIEAAEENLRDVWVTLSAEIARNYIELRGLQQRKKLLLKNIEGQQESLHLTQELLKKGIADAIDVLQGEEQCILLMAQRPLLDLSIDKTLYRLSTLLGCPFEELFAELTIPQELPSLPSEKPIGLPADLLRRRPDIRRAERHLAAATESIGSAVSALFPRFSLYGFIGEIGGSMRSLTNGRGATWFAAPQLLFPIFNSCLLRQHLEGNKIEARQALFNYQKAVLTALEEVESAMAAFLYDAERKDHLTQVQKIDREASRLTFQLYQRGIKDYPAVLATHRSLLAAEEVSIQSQVDLLLDYVSLYKALGGGWDLSQFIPR